MRLSIESQRRFFEEYSVPIGELQTLGSFEGIVAHLKHKFILNPNDTTLRTLILELGGQVHEEIADNTFLSLLKKDSPLSLFDNIYVQIGDPRTSTTFCLPQNLFNKVRIILESQKKLTYEKTLPAVEILKLDPASFTPRERKIMEELFEQIQRSVAQAKRRPNI